MISNGLSSYKPSFMTKILARLKRPLSSVSTYGFHMFNPDCIAPTNENCLNEEDFDLHIRYTYMVMKIGLSFPITTHNSMQQG